MLNDLEKSYVQRFVEEQAMIDSVQKAILQGYQEHLPQVKSTDTDEILGQRTRAFNTACELLSTVLKDMVKYRKVGKNYQEINLER